MVLTPAASTSAANSPVEAESSNAARVPNNAEENAAADLIQEPDKDIAINEYGEQLRVGVAGRKRCQVIYISTSASGKRTSDSYKVENDAPPAGWTLSIKPTPQELTEGHNTEAHIVVGVILAHTPLEYSDKRKGPGGKSEAAKDLAKARKERGVLPATEDLLRVTLPCTEYIAASHKYYVACQQKHGLCTMRVITSDAVFFFEEVWESVNLKGNHTYRKSNLGQACRTLAAVHKKPDPRPLTVVKEGGAQKACHDLEVTPEQNAANMLWMQYSVWQVSKEPAQLDVLIETVRKILPDLAKRPANEGTAAFYLFEEEMEAHEAEILVQEVKAAYPSICELDSKLILAAHAVLRKNGRGACLPYGSLALFLELLHDRAKAEWDAERLSEVVDRILHDVELMNKFPSASCQWTASEEEGEKTTALINLISALRQLFRELQQYLSKGADALKEQHGGIQAHESLDDLMQKIGAVVDKTSLVTLEEQVFAIHGEQKATILVRGADIAGQAVELIDGALRSA